MYALFATVTAHPSTAAAVTLRTRVAPHIAPWTLIGQITHGRFVARRAPTRPG